MARTNMEKKRAGFLFAVIILFFCMIAARLVHLQVVNAAEYKAIVQRQSGGEIDIPAERGVIYDRTGKIVANNIYKSSIYVSPRTNQELADAAAYIDKLYGNKKGTAKKRHGLASGSFRWVQRMVSDGVAAKVEANAPVGVKIRRETQRDYPFDLVGRQILGFTNIDNKGAGGVEYSLNSILAGKPGKADIRRDAHANTFRVKEQALVKPQPGQSIVLTIDWRLQEIVEQELSATVLKHNAKSGTAAFVDCNSGDILAIAHFDPNEKNRNRPNKLRAIADQYEPGSIFKVFAAAALLDKGMVDFNDSTYCELGKWKVNRRILHDDKKLGWLNFRQIIELSSNIGISKYALELGGDELIAVCERFGLGKKPLLTLPSVASGKITPPKRWSEYNTAAFTIGHSVSVSTLQMANAFAAIANGGELLKSNLILGYVDDDGYVVRDRGCEVIVRAMEEKSSDSLRAMLRGVVERGTAKNINSKAVTIAGKTGTAQIWDKKTGRYSYRNYMASFAGFFPAEKPLVAGVVVIEAPQPVHYGGWTAGPAFQKVAERYAVLNHDLFAGPENIIHENSKSSNRTIEIPDLAGYNWDDAVRRASDEGLQIRSNDSVGVVVWQFPLADRLMFSNDELLVAFSSNETAALSMIDLRGLSLKKASAFCDYAGIRYEITGTGNVVKQSIRPGSEISKSVVCRLNCKSI